MKILNAVSLILFISFLAIGCGSSGDGSDPDPNPNPGSNLATGRITGVSLESGQIELTITSTNFKCGPDETGSDTQPLSYLDATTMIWPQADLTWTRNAGDPNDIRGTWRTEGDGNSLTLTITDNYSFTVTGTMDCGSSSGGGGNPTTDTTYKTADYFPLGQGDTWTYIEEDLESTIQTISDTENIGGVDAIKKIDEDGDYELFTNSNGVTFYKSYDADDIAGCGWSMMIFTPPVIMIPAEISIGSTYTFNSTLNHTECTGFSESSSVSVETTIEGFEDVTVTAGTFKDCLKIKMKITMNLPNNQVNINDNTTWHAKGVGEVKSTSSSIINGNVINVYTHDLISSTVGGVHYQ